MIFRKLSGRNEVIGKVRENWIVRRIYSLLEVVKDLSQAFRDQPGYRYSGYPNPALNRTYMLYDGKVQLLAT